MTDVSKQKNEYARMISLFLAELLRTRKTSLNRAADISQKVVENINLIDTEVDFLRFVQMLTSEFDEMVPMKEVVQLHIRKNHRVDLEQKVKSFVIHIMQEDPNHALEVLQEASKDDAKLPDLCLKYPKLKQFIEINRH
jgi:hypothetical protein